MGSLGGVGSFIVDGAVILSFAKLRVEPVVSAVTALIAAFDS